MVLRWVGIFRLGLIRAVAWLRGVSYMIHLLLLYLWDIAYFILTKTGIFPVVQDALERLIFQPKCSNYRCTTKPSPFSTKF